MTRRPSRRRLLLAGLLTVVVLSGCGQKKITITQYPSFFNPDDPSTNVKSLVVLPFRNQAGPQAEAAKAGDAIAEKLYGMLAGTRTYSNIYNRNDLGALAEQQDLQVAAGAEPSTTAALLRKRGNVEAVLTGAVTAYASSTSQKRQQIPQYAWNARTKRVYISGYKTVIITTNEGNVQVTATLTKVSNGAAIHSTPPISARSVAKGQSPDTDEHGVLRRAADQAAMKLMEHFAVVRKTIEVKGDAFKTASELYDGKWQHTGKFKTTDKRMFVVLKLPDNCDRNRFRVTIVRDGEREVLATRTIVWKAGDGRVGRGMEFDPSQIAAKGGGAGKYMAKFYPGLEPNLEPKLSKKFKIVEP